MDDERIARDLIERLEKGQPIETKEMVEILRMARERIQECERRIHSYEHALTMIKILAFYTDDRDALKEVFEVLRKILVI